MLHHSVDHLLLREGQIFSYGWGFYPSQQVLRLVLRLEFNMGSPVEIDAEYGRQRDDVEKFFPDVPEAKNAGFLIFAGTDGRKVTRAALLWELKDQVIEVLLDLPQDGGGEKAVSSGNYYRAMFWRAIALLRSAGVMALIRKVGRYLSDRPRPVDDAEWRSLRIKLRGRSLAVVVDHNMGGGANIYRHEYVRERIAGGEVVLLLGFHVASLQYFVEVLEADSVRRYSIDSPEALVFLVSHADVRHLLYNCAVSFRRPLAVIDTLLAIRRQAACELLVTIHDYFVICPSHFLINRDGRYCGVPDQEQCRRCLPDHRDGFVSVAGERDIDNWRQQWSRLLVAADEVRMFSNSSKHLLKRAYPSIPDETWRVVPHALHTQVPTVQVPAGQHLHIGIVGTIGKHKGSQIVSDLASEIIKRKSSAKITVIGTLEAKVPNNVVTVTGAYAPEHLAELIKGSGANVFLFPSIWAETFSYVSHELVAMGVPFACFDFGAPADLARSYERGLILGSMDADDILSRLECFWRKIYRMQEEIV